MDDFGFTRLDAERKAPVLYARSIDSTNNALKKLAAQGAPDGTVLWASEQTAGRGRLGRSFLSPEGGLYLSMLWRPDCPPEKTVSLTSCAAVALCRCLEAWPELDVSIKWPNDVLLGGRKLCGILTEGCTTSMPMSLQQEMYLSSFSWLLISEVSRAAMNSTVWWTLR